MIEVQELQCIMQGIHVEKIVMSDFFYFLFQNYSLDRDTTPYTWVMERIPFYKFLKMLGYLVRISCL